MWENIEKDLKDLGFVKCKREWNTKNNVYTYDIWTLEIECEIGRSNYFYIQTTPQCDELFSRGIIINSIEDLKKFISFFC